MTNSNILFHLPPKMDNIILGSGTPLELYLMKIMNTLWVKEKMFFEQLVQMLNSTSSIMIEIQDSI